jgi:hypothetical protein
VICLGAAFPGFAVAEEAAETPSPPERVGQITDPRWKEISGIAPVSGRKGLFWIHNDSGDKPRIAAVHESGSIAARFTVAGASATDWEGIAAGPCPGTAGTHLYIADTGNNKGTRKDLSIYRFPEPEVGEPSPDAERETARAGRIRFRYPDGAFDCEAIAVHPETGKIYLFTKEMGRSRVYTCENSPGSRTAVLVATLSPDLCVTAADISRDGTRLLLRTYIGVEEHRLPAGAPFDAIFREPKRRLPPPIELQGEAICFDHDTAGYLTVGEGKMGLIHRVRRLEKAPPAGGQAPGDGERGPVRGGAPADPGAR